MIHELAVSNKQKPKTEKPNPKPSQVVSAVVGAVKQALQPSASELLTSPKPLTSPEQDEDELNPATGKVRVLVYGSLKAGCGNHILMERINAEFLGYDSISGDFSMISFGGFPGVIRTTVDNTAQVKTIFGELYYTDEEGLAALDLLESHPDWYERRKYRTDVLDYRAWMYTLPGGEGYLDATRYNQVEACMWLPKPDELAFWHAQDDGNTSV